MAKKIRNEVAVGLTVLIVLILSFYIVVVLADWPGAYEPKQEITVQLPYQTGLRGLTDGSPIFIGGAKVGHITKTGIDYHPDQNDALVFFTMKLPRKYLLRHDCVLVPESNVLGGQTMLIIKDLGREGKPLLDGTTVDLPLGASLTDALKHEFDPENPDSLLARLKFEVDRDNEKSIIAALAQTAHNLHQISAKIDRQITLDDDKQTLMAKLHAVMDTLRQITERIDVQLDTENNRAVVARLSTALDKLDTSLAQIKDLIATGKPDLTGLLASLHKTAQKLETDLPAITTQIKTTLDKVDSSLDTAQTTLQHFKDFSAGARDTVVVNRDRIDLFLANLTEISSNLKLASQDIRRAPWKLLYKPKKDELKIQGLIDAAGAFAAGAERLDSASLRLRSSLTAAGDKMTFDREALKRIVAEIETSFNQFKQAEKTFWNELPD